MSKVTLCVNPFRPETWKEFPVDNLCEFLLDHYGKWPKGARIYHEKVSHATDVTPRDEGSVVRLANLTGNFYVLEFPQHAIIIPLLISLAINAVQLTITLLLRPSNNTKNQQQTSPNNQLANRQNRERPNERIEDILGEVWCTPTLIQVPYRVFQANKEVEYCYMCVGRGEYDISKVRDDLTPFENIDGASCEFYGPNTSPNSGDEPFLRIGNPINTKVIKVKQYQSANGQVLRAPNAGTFKSDKNISFVYSDSIILSGQFDFTDYFAIGSVAEPNHIILSGANAVDPGGHQPTVNLDGTYEIADVQQNEIVLVNPALVNPNWNALANFTGQASTFGSPTITSTDDRWVGTFIINEPDVTEVWCNFVCPNGLYELDQNARQFLMDVQVEVGIQAIDINNNPVGTEVKYNGTILGSAVFKTLRGITLKCVLPLPGPCRVRARRYSNTDLRDKWNVVDQTQWKDLYAVSPVSQLHFGNVTTVQTVTWPTQDALAIKQRKFNCLIGKRVPFYRPRYYAQGPWTAFSNSVKGEYNDALGKLFWQSARPSASTAKIGILTDGSVFSEVTLTGVPTGNSGGLDGVWLHCDGTYLYMQIGSGYDTAAWLKYPIAGGAPVAQLGGIGVFSGPFSIGYSSALISVGGNKYILHGRGGGIQRIDVSSFTLATGASVTNAEHQMVQDVNEHTWTYGGTHILTEIDWSGPTVTNHTVTGTSDFSLFRNITYVAADHSLIVLSGNKLYKYDITTNTVVATATLPGSFDGAGLSNVGADGNVCVTRYGPTTGFTSPVDTLLKYDSLTLALVDTIAISLYVSAQPLISTGFGYNNANFIHYDSTANTLDLVNSAAKVNRLNLTQDPGLDFGTLRASRNAADALFHIATDPYIGNRDISEIDLEGIYNAIGPGGANEQYFGTPLCSEFCYTFDDSKVSFEEMAVDIANAAFSVAYRQGNLLSVFFEKETSSSSMLFNHRNKLPGTETRTVRFGLPSDADGVQLDYIDPKAPNQPDQDVTNTLYYPEDQSAKSAKKVTTIGVRNNVQAKLLGWRIFNKMRYQNTSTEFSATQEAATLIAAERVLIADNTRSDTQDGDVLDQVSLELTLSQPVTFIGGHSYTIFLQHYDRTVESIAITPGSAPNKVVLGTTPALPLVYDKNKFARTTYQIVDNNNSMRSSAFLLSEKSPRDGMVYDIKAMNYDARYYEHDTDFINNIVTENSGSGGYNGGYSAQSQTKVFVQGTCMPWMPKDNPSYDYGLNDGKPPIVVKLLVAPGGSINIAADAPGQITTVWLWTFATNTVVASDARKPVDASGTSIDPGYTSPITGTTTGSTGKYFPTKYMVGQFALGLCGLCGCFAKLETTGKYTVKGPISIGLGGTFVIPADATHLLLGTNDDHYSDNTGGFNVTVTQLGLPGEPPVDTTTGDSSDGSGWQVDGSGPGENTPPAGEFLLSEKFGHNVSASSTYDADHHPDNFTGTSVTGSSTTVSIDTSKMDDSMNPSTPAHVSDVSIHDCFTTIPSSVPKGVHVTPWFGKPGSHINIGVNCNTDAYVINLWNDLDRRGYDFISVDWYGIGSFEDLFLQRFKNYNATKTTPKKIVVCIDKGMSGLSTLGLIAAINYIDSQYFSKAIMIGGKPLLQFFGVRNRLSTILGSDAAADTALATVKSTVSTAAHWDWFEQSLRHHSYVDGCFDWTRNFEDGVDDSDYGTYGPYNLHAHNVFYTDMADEPTKTIGAAIVAGFNGTETYSTRWSKNKYLPRNHGGCWVATIANADSNYNSQVKYVMADTWSDYEEGSEIETGIPNDISFATCSITGHTLNWSVTGGTGDESTIFAYRIISSSDGKFGKYVATIATGVGTKDLSTITDFEAGKTYDLYLEAVGLNSVRCVFSNRMAYTA